MSAHMVVAPLDMRAFNRWAAERGFVRGGAFDEGFALHVLLSSSFGKGVLQPFRLFSSPRRASATLYAYADEGDEALAGLAATVAPPDCLDVLDVGRMRSKSIPTAFAEGQRLGFDIRVRPVRRLNADTEGKNGGVLRKGSEVDAFVIGPAREDGCSLAGERSAPRREAVYTRWLAERLDGVAMVDRGDCRLASFRRTRTVRGNGPGPEGPDAILHGELTVSNTDGFMERLRRGVGRHKAYGYRMLLLRPPAPAKAR